jgi:hypothetical protein
MLRRAFYPYARPAANENLFRAGGAAKKARRAAPGLALEPGSGEDDNRNARGREAARRASAFSLMGLRYAEQIAAQVYAGITAMEESVTYQAIIRKGMEKGIVEGKLQEGKRLLLLLGQNRFGAPDAEVRAAVEALTDLERVEWLSQRLLDVSGWHELLS